MQIQCDVCGAVVPATAIEAQAGRATCAACGHEFSCQDQLDDGVLQAAQQRPQVPMPAGIRVFRRSGNGLMITRRWLSARVIFLLVFACLWDACLIAWYGFTLSRALWPLAAFGALHVLVGIGITYATLAGLVNTTVITALQGLLEIRHGPLPWPGNRRLEAVQLVQLYTKRLVRRSRHGVYTSYQLRAQTRDGKDIKLLGVERENQALFVEQRLEEFLGIDDRPVLGEVERR